MHLGADWANAAATFVTGALAVFAAFFTFYRSRQSEKAASLERKIAVTRRARAVLEVTIGGVKQLLETPPEMASTMPWTAYEQLVGDIGVLDLNKVRRFIFAESLVRDLETSTKPATDRVGDPAPLSSDAIACATRLLSHCSSLVKDLERGQDSLEKELDRYYSGSWLFRTRANEDRVAGAQLSADSD